MFGSNILDVVIGLVFLFLLLSLICSAATELIEAFLKQRAKGLEAGIIELLGKEAAAAGDDPNRPVVSFISRIYNHGLVNSLYRGDYNTTPKTKLPSYIPARNFALALISVATDANNTAALPANVRSALQTFVKAGENDAPHLQKSVEDWYNSATDRISGIYKRRTQVIIFCLGIVLAIIVNADCIQYATRLSKDSSLRQGVVALAEASAKQDPTKDNNTPPSDRIKADINALDSIGLPIGWDKQYEHSLSGAWNATWDHGIGWLLTAFAVSLGAPFWFDMLNKLIVVRSTVKPDEKSPEEGSKDLAPKQSAPPQAPNKS
jgi:hypothetical protein